MMFDKCILVRNYENLECLGEIICRQYCACDRIGKLDRYGLGVGILCAKDYLEIVHEDKFYLSERKKIEY